MAISYHRGNVFDSQCQAIAHGVNLTLCEDSGLAAQVWENYPNAHREYEEALKHDQLHAGGILPISVGKAMWIVNIASQVEPGPSAKLDYLQKGVHDTLEWARRNSIEGVAFPAIGSGVGGLSIRDSLIVLESEAQNYPDVNVEIWIYPEEE